MQPLDLQEYTVPHLKDLINICLEPEAQDCGMTFNRFYVGSNALISYHTEANGCIFFAAGVKLILPYGVFINHITLMGDLGLFLGKAVVP